MNDDIITIALATRLKRRVFSDVNVQKDADELIRENIVKLSIDLLDIHFEEYGVILVLKNPEHIASDYISFFIRNTTSAPLRTKHQKLQKMPSLWSKKFFCEDGTLTEDMKRKIEVYYGEIKSK